MSPRRCSILSLVHALHVREADPSERAWIAEQLERRWGSTRIASRGRSRDAARLPALICRRRAQRVGLATFAIEGNACELVTFDALEAGQGIVSALLDAVLAAARGARRARVAAQPEPGSGSSVSTRGLSAMTRRSRSTPKSGSWPESVTSVATSGRKETVNDPLTWPPT
jgi:hypothetical protein